MGVWALLPLSLVAEYVDSTLGMGYGTSLTPILLLLGHDPAKVVPAVLFSEFISGLLAAASHHKVGNVNLRLGSPHLRVAVTLSALSIIGALVAVVLSLHLPAKAIKLYIGFLVAGMGLLILVRSQSRRPFSWFRLISIGILAAFNKGISGGGYGPLITAGQIISGVNSKNAIGITSFAEGITCAVGVIAYAMLRPESAWQLAAPLSIGAALSVPLSALSVRRMPEHSFTSVVGSAILVLGLLTLIRALVG
mgnify:CR=1 FL=1